MMRSRSAELLSWLLIALISAGISAGSVNAQAPKPDSKATPKVDFARQVQPILAKKCYACHGPDEAESGLNLSNQEGAFAEAESGEHAIVAGDINASQLIARITSDDEFERMPPEGDAVTEEEIAILTQWIQQGAEWNKHWAFQPMKRHQPPRVSDIAWNENPIDAFVFDQLSGANLKPNEQADRATLVRRAYYDLLGLPPTVEQVKAFVDDTDPLAFERLVDELLESPHYGERWGRYWLDLVRYAETNSYERDGAKPNAWKYRDYVIKSLNDDKPYDQFLREQLAGDELDEVTVETLTATGYYRLGIWDDEPVDAAQARFDGLDDIIMTTGQAMLGLTINCARCHDHKIDPIPQSDYYSMLSFLEDLTPYGRRGDQMTFSQIDITKGELKERYAESLKEKAELEKAKIAIEQEGIKKMSAPDQRATEGTKRDRKRVLSANLRKNLSKKQWQDYQDIKGKIADNEKAYKKLPPRDTVMGLAAYRKIDKPTFVLYRGNPASPTDEVSPAFPSIFEADAPTVPKQDGAKASGRRRILADWVASPDNMLTARVMANRIWQYHFGRGIVRSSNNFGQLGTPPTHPKLLDWLALRLIEGDWKLKSMHRLIMTSKTYQMSSTARADGLAHDPDNEHFWRFNPRRLSAEEVRDSILAANGSLNRQTYGPSIYPALSAEVKAGQSKPGSGWGNSSPVQQNRRSVYIHVKRSLLTPLLSAFDFPDPDLTCEARFMTLQPAQALTMMNSEFIHQQAKRLAESAGADLPDDQFVDKVVRATLGREATENEISEGIALINKLKSDHKLSKDRVRSLYALTVMNWNEFLFVD